MKVVTLKRFNRGRLLHAVSPRAHSLSQLQIIVTKRYIVRGSKNKFFLVKLKQLSHKNN